MPNVWYKDHIGLVGPILVGLFNHCRANSDIPPLFNQATVF